MKFSLTTAVLAAGLIAGAAAAAAPANADPIVDVNDVLSSLSAAGITNIDPGTAIAVGQSMCPLLAQRGQNSADIASTVADAIGKPLGVAPMFAGGAISALCPGAVDTVAGDLGR